ncbi:MAG: hypothetical protein U0U70_14295 [Chitinophagaceae bacterium]
MARPKKTYRVYEKALQRMASLKSIDPNFDFGGNVNAVSYQQTIDDMKASMDDYNTSLSLVDEKSNSFKDKEDILNDMNERVLLGAAARFGKDSSAYEQAGGTRKSERKKPVRKAKKVS